MKLSQEALEEKRNYFREWRGKNPDKVKKHVQSYWERKAEKSNSIENRIKTLHTQGYSLREIATKVEINHMKVRRILKEN